MAAIGGVSSSLVDNVCRLLKFSNARVTRVIAVLNAQFSRPVILVSAAVVTK